MTTTDTFSGSVPAGSEVPASGGLRVLLVEDSAGDRWFLSEMLRARAYTVISCETGESAWEAFQEEPSDLILLDVMLPGMDGMELCRRIRAHPRGRTPVILAATGKEEPQALQEMLDAGADDFIRKPVDPDILNVRLAIAERRLRDRRERARTGAALELKTRELETLFENVREVFVSIDLSEGRLIQVSPQAEALFGVPAWRLLEEPELWKQYFQLGVAWEDLLENPPDDALTHEYGTTSPDGVERWVRASVNVERDTDTGILRADGVFVDTTTEHRANLDAAAHNEELLALHRLSEITLSATTLEQAYQDMIDHVSDVLGCPIAAIEQLDSDRDRLVVLAARGLDLPDDDFLSVPLHHSLSGVAVRTGQPVIESDPKSRKEHKVPFLKHLNLAGFASFPLVAGGEVRGTLMLASTEPKAYDERFRRMCVSMSMAIAVYLERLEAEAALRESEALYRAMAGELQQANQELEAFAYSVSHDLRAPLRTMQGFAHALLQKFGDELPAEARDFARRIIASGQQSEGLISDLLAYSRLTFERMDLKPVDLKSVVEAALEQVQADVQDANAHVDVAKGLPSVLGNHSTLVQVMANLVANAVKFVPSDRTPEVRISAEEAGDQVRVSVTDNGIGVPEGQEERIFRVFERLLEGGDYPGTGIGLALVRKGMQRIGGTCGVDRLPDGGSSFWIEVPKERRTGWRRWGKRGKASAESE